MGGGPETGFARFPTTKSAQMCPNVSGVIFVTYLTDLEAGGAVPELTLTSSSCFFFGFEGQIYGVS